MTDIINFLTQRRSVTAKNMTEPGPSDDQLEQILAAGIRVPDHGRLGPWQFIIIKGDARAKFGEVLADAYQKANDDAFDELLDVERERFQRAPVVIAVTSRVTKGHKIPEWEQELSSGAACMNMLNAAHAMGFTAQWLTEWPAYNGDVAAALGLGENERIAGFVYVGSPVEPPTERKRAALEDIVREWNG
ncbi:MAG: nitroreductase [Rhodospirillales bacterium]|nr:nitroreductase [Rhodospirillales bacterium]